jgi:hypothetical protein
MLDVTDLELDENQQLTLQFAVTKYYESNFWIKFKSTTMMSWAVLVLA